MAVVSSELASFSLPGFHIGIRLKEHRERRQIFYDVSLKIEQRIKVH
jgi:hypothetical protein